MVFSSHTGQVLMSSSEVEMCFSSLVSRTDTASVAPDNQNTAILGPFDDYYSQLGKTGVFGPRRVTATSDWILSHLRRSPSTCVGHRHCPGPRRCSLHTHSLHSLQPILVQLAHTIPRLPHSNWACNSHPLAQTLIHESAHNHRDEVLTPIFLAHSTHWGLDQIV